MQPRVKNSLYVVVGTTAFVVASWAAFAGYLSPEMMVYFLSFKWCF